VAPLEKAELAQVAAILACAFRDNPLNRAVVASADPSRRLRANRYGMLALLPAAHDLGSVLVAKSEGSITGALVSSPPNRFPLPPPAWWPQLRCLIGQGWRVARRWGDVFDELLQLHPIEPHWYLATLGVDPSQQHRGVGTALLDAWLIGVDRSGLPAYLETDGASNVAYYQRAGFRVANQTEVLGVTVWCMSRPGHTPSPSSLPEPQQANMFEPAEVPNRSDESE
jgi:hypothetical protein